MKIETSFTSDKEPVEKGKILGALSLQVEDFAPQGTPVSKQLTENREAFKHQLRQAVTQQVIPKIMAEQWPSSDDDVSGIPAKLEIQDITVDGGELGDISDFGGETVKRRYLDCLGISIFSFDAAMS